MIQINNLEFSYAHAALFQNLNLTLDRNGICGLLGKNGAGKTTLLKLLAGLVFPTHGVCQVLKYNPANRDPNFLAEIFYLPEDIYVPALKVNDYLNCYAGFYKNFDKTIFDRAAQEFELTQSKLLSEFSHGQKKKFLIAFGLATQCRLFILDEPTNGLDIPSKAQFRKLLASTISADKLFIISTHQVHDVENLIDSVVILDEGKILLQKSLHEISEKLAFSFQQVEPNPNTYLYAERSAGGYQVLASNQDNKDTHIDLEIFFNAMLNNKTKIPTIFNEVK